MTGHEQHPAWAQVNQRLAAINAEVLRVVKEILTEEAGRKTQADLFAPAISKGIGHICKDGKPRTWAASACFGCGLGEKLRNAKAGGAKPGHE